MKKIPTVFIRDPENRAHVLPTVNPGCEWVLDGDGVATIKFDGTCTMFDGEQWWARREVKRGRPEPLNWREADNDPVTGKRTGWEPIGQSTFAKIFESARKPASPKAGATYELIGPKVNGNPHGDDFHSLARHGFEELRNVPRDFDGLRDYLLCLPSPGHPGYIEGIVFWRKIDDPEAGLAKLKVRDFR